MRGVDGLMVLLPPGRVFRLVKTCLAVALCVCSFVLYLRIARESATSGDQDEETNVNLGKQSQELLQAVLDFREREKHQSNVVANGQANDNERLIFEKLDYSFEHRVSQPSEDERLEWRRPRSVVDYCEKDQLVDGKCPFVKEDRYPIVVWWTPFTYYKHIIRRCSLGRCMFTHNRREKKNPRTKAFLFYGSSIEMTDWPLPRSPRHEWVLLHEESPKNVYMFNHAEALSVFNLTSTFRRESDFPLTLQWLKSVDDLTDKTYFVSTAEKNKL